MKNLSLYIDLAFCVFVLPVMVMIFPVERWYHNFPCYVVTFAVWLYAVYVLNRIVTVPLLFKGERGKAVGMAMVVLSLAVTYFFSKVGLYTPKPNALDVGIDRILPLVPQYQQAVWTLFMIVEAFSFAVGLMVQSNVQRARMCAIEAERDRAEIELYRAQIKPHFMFNTLNTIYGLFLTKSERALESLEKFISMMRYIHTTSRCGMASLSDEAGYIRQYTELQSLRLNGMTSVSLDIDIEDGTLVVPPMLLVTFVENCFKHGVSPVERSDIRIYIKEKSGQLNFTTENRIFPTRRIGEHSGIDNCRKRLDILYPAGRHEMVISDDGNTYKVKLNIRLKA